MVFFPGQVKLRTGGACLVQKELGAAKVGSARRPPSDHLPASRCLGLQIRRCTLLSFIGRLESSPFFLGVTLCATHAQVVYVDCKSFNIIYFLTDLHLRRDSTPPKTKYSERTTTSWLIAVMERIDTAVEDQVDEHVNIGNADTMTTSASKLTRAKTTIDIETTLATTETVAIAADTTATEVEIGATVTELMTGTVYTSLPAAVAITMQE